MKPLKPRRNANSTSFASTIRRTDRARLPALVALSLALTGCATTRESSPTTTPVPDPAPVNTTEGPKGPLKPLPPDERPFAACRAAVTPGEVDPTLIDGTRELIEETTCGAALWFDGLFGDGDLRTARRTHGRIETSVSHSEFDGTHTRVRFNVRAKFPALEERLSAFVGRDDDEGFVRDRSEGQQLRSQFPRVDDEDEWLAGLGYSLPDAHAYRADFRVGARGGRRPKAFAQWRYSWMAYADRNDLVHLRLTPFINTHDGFGQTTALDYSRTLTPTKLLRWANVGTVHEKSLGLDWRSSLLLYQNLRELRALAYEVFLRGLTAAPEPLGEYGLRATYRHPLFEAKMFAEMVVGYSWPRNDPALERDGSAGAGIGFEMPFGSPPG